jgi:ParB-like chromosome segregation protein Spo0J
MKLTDIKQNPNNPRVIKDEKFDKLVKSIRDFPKMMELRPMVINSDNIVLGGNMRLKALKELGYKEVPNEWVKRAEDLTEDEQRQFIIKDNVGFGEHDWEVLVTEWDADELSEWGLDIPNKKEVDEKDLFDIDLPFYEPSEIKPEINELANIDKTIELINKIDLLKIEDNLKEILKIRASFFTDFNFQKIADFYYKESDEVKEVFKDLGLVILAPKEAIKKGFISLKEDVFEL